MRSATLDELGALADIRADCFGGGGFVARLLPGMSRNQMKAELMRAEFALGGVLPAGKATLAPRAEKQGERRKASPPPVHSGEWF